MFGFACEGVEACFSQVSIADLILPFLATVFAVLGTLAAAAYSVAMRRNLKEVGFGRLLKLAVGSTDFALSIFVFPILFLIVIRAISETNDVILALVFSFETGFVTKSILAAMSASNKEVS